MSQSLYQLIGTFVVRHWRAYIASALMLIGIAVLTVWVPRIVGQAVDALVAGTLQGAALARELLCEPPSAPVAPVPADGEEAAVKQPTFVCMHCGCAMIVLQSFKHGQPIRAPPKP